MYVYFIDLINLASIFHVNSSEEEPMFGEFSAKNRPCEKRSKYNRTNMLWIPRGSKHREETTAFDQFLKFSISLFCSYKKLSQNT